MSIESLTLCQAISRLANVDYILLNKYLKTNQNAQRSAAVYNMEMKIRDWLDNGDVTVPGNTCSVC